LHQRAGHEEVLDGGNSYGGSVGFRIAQELAERREGAGGELARYGPGTGAIGITHANELNLAGLRQVAIDARMIASESACPDNGNADFVSRFHGIGAVRIRASIFAPLIS
jgi:hypothetical protein